MATVSQLLVLKGHAVHAIDSGATVFEAIERMVAHNVGALLVMDGPVTPGAALSGDRRQDSLMSLRPTGMVTERDYLSKVALQGRASRTTLVEAIMTKGLITVDPDASIESCMALMTEKRIRHLPVMDGALLTGILSIGDIVKYLAHDRQAQIEQLTAYIQGSEMAHA